MSKGMAEYWAKKTAVYSKYNGKCAYCGSDIEKTNFHIDHFLPKNKRGSDQESNLMPSCASCNTCKSDLSIEEFRYRISDRVFRLNKYSSEYQIAKRFGLISEIDTGVSFYFETINSTM